MIRGATATTYRVSTADIGAVLSLRVTATNPFGSAIATSAGVGPSLAQPPVNTTPPAVTGSPTSSAVLTASTGVWSPAATSYAFQWEHNLGSGFVDIPGASASTYRVSTGETNALIRVRVTARNADGTSSALSGSVGPVSVPTPVNTVAPKILGAAKTQTVLTATIGQWNPGGTGYTIQWQRDSGSGFADVPGAKLSTYRLGTVDRSTVIRLRITAVNGPVSTVAYSAPLGPVIAQPPVNTVLPKVLGSVLAGATLTGTTGTWNPAGSSYSYQWLRDGGSGFLPVAGQTAHGLQAHIVRRRHEARAAGDGQQPRRDVLGRLARVRAGARDGGERDGAGRRDGAGEVGERRGARQRDRRRRPRGSRDARRARDRQARAPGARQAQGHGLRRDVLDGAHARLARREGDGRADRGRPRQRAARALTFVLGALAPFRSGIHLPSTRVMRLLVVTAVLTLVLASPAAAELQPGYHDDTVQELASVDVSGAVGQAKLRSLDVGVAASNLPLTWCGTATTTDDTADATFGAALPQFKLVYAYPSDRPNRFSQWADALQADVSLIEQFVSSQPGSARAPRFDMGTSCGPQYVDIQTVALPGTRAGYVQNMSAVESYVKTKLNASPGGPRDVVILADTLSSGGLNGVGELYEGSIVLRPSGRRATSTTRAA